MPRSPSEKHEANMERQFHAGKNRVAVVDHSRLGRLRLTGVDSLDLLHRLSTQDLNSLQPGQGATTVLTSEKGRIVDVLTVLHSGDHLLLVTSPDNQGHVVAWLDKYTIIEDSDALDITGQTGLLGVFGPDSDALAAVATGVGLVHLPMHHHLPAKIGEATVTVIRAPEPGGGFLIWVHEEPLLDSVRDRLLLEGKDLEATYVGSAVYEMLRIEAGLPVFGHEIDDRFNPLEAGLEALISFNKGCYIGQEVVARLDSYDKVQKRLMGLLLPPGGVPPPGTRLEADGKEAGFVTSATWTPTRKGPIAMAYVRRAHAYPGCRLGLPSEDGPAVAEVVALPF